MIAQDLILEFVEGRSPYAERLFLCKFGDVTCLPVAIMRLRYLSLLPPPPAPLVVCGERLTLSRRPTLVLGILRSTNTMERDTARTGCSRVQYSEYEILK